MKNKTGQLLIHITGCIAFLSLPVLLSPDVSWNFRFLQLRPFQEDFLSYTLILLFFLPELFPAAAKTVFQRNSIFSTLPVLPAVTCWWQYCQTS